MEIIATARTTTSPELYKEFFTTYYKKKMRGVRVILALIATALIAFGFYALSEQMSIFISAVPIAAGIVMIIYPAYAYRRPYKAVKDNVQTLKYEFYPDRYVEYMDNSKQEYKYSELMTVTETAKYIYLFHTHESASVVDKDRVKKMTAQELSEHLKKSVANG